MSLCSFLFRGRCFESYEYSSLINQVFLLFQVVLRVVLYQIPLCNIWNICTGISAFHFYSFSYYSDRKINISCSSVLYKAISCWPHFWLILLWTLLIRIIIISLVFHQANYPMDFAIKCICFLWYHIFHLVFCYSEIITADSISVKISFDNIAFFFLFGQWRSYLRFENHQFFHICMYCTVLIYFVKEELSDVFVPFWQISDFLHPIKNIFIAYYLFIFKIFCRVSPGSKDTWTSKRVSRIVLNWGTRGG